MAQNIYDDPAFFAGYAQLPRSEHGLPAVFEWPAFQRLLPGSLEGKRVLDLGCGVGYLARELRTRGARAVTGRAGTGERQWVGRVATVPARRSRWMRTGRR